MAKIYTKGANCILIVFDIAEPLLEYSPEQALNRIVNKWVNIHE